MRRQVWIRPLGTSLFALTIAACRPADAPPVEPQSTGAQAGLTTADPGSATGDEPLTVIVGRQGERVITADDFRRGVAWRSLLNGEPIEAAYGPTWLDDDRLVRRLVHSMLDEALLRADADRFGLEISAEARADAYDQVLPVSALDDLSDEARTERLADLGLTEDDLRWAIEERAIYTLWADHRVASLTDDDRWNAWSAAHDRVTLELVIVPNTPSREAIDAVLAERADDVRRYYDERRNHFLRRPRARVRLVRVFADTDDRGDDAPGRRRIDELRTVATPDTMPTLAADHSEDPSAGRGDGTTWVTDDRIPAAFEVEVGAITPVVEDRTGWYFAEVLERVGRELRPLDDDVQREIATILARQAGPAPASAEIANRVLEAMAESDDGLDDLVDELRLRRQTTPSFRHTNAGVVPLVGEEPALLERAFALAEVGDAITEPVHTEAGLVVARLAERERPTRQAYEVERETFAEEFAGFVRENAWRARIAEELEANPREVDLDALRVALRGDPAR